MLQTMVNYFDRHSFNCNLNRHLLQEQLFQKIASSFKESKAFGTTKTLKTDTDWVIFLKKSLCKKGR